MEIKLKNGGGERNQVSGNFIHPCNLIFTIASQVFDYLCIRRVRQHTFMFQGCQTSSCIPLYPLCTATLRSRWSISAHLSTDRLATGKQIVVIS